MLSSLPPCALTEESVARILRAILASNWIAETHTPDVEIASKPFDLLIYRCHAAGVQPRHCRKAEGPRMAAQQSIQDPPT